MDSIINGHIYKDNQFIEDHVLLYDQVIIDIIPRLTYDQKILSGELKISEQHDAQGHFVVPGFIDVHIHGYKGSDVMDTSSDSVQKIRENIVENGVTSFLATTMTMEKPRIEQALNHVSTTMENQKLEEYATGASIIGAHLEGPFINKTYKGAQAETHIIKPDQDLVEAYKDIIKVITIAPEIPGSIDLIDLYKDQIRFSMGHSGATFKEATEAISHGACCVTHLFNAMTGLHHREPGMVGAALTQDIYAELIADNVHVNPSLYPLVIESVGEDKLLLITDCISAGGLSDGTYSLGGSKVNVINGQCKLESGTLAGSVLRLNQGIKHIAEAAHLPLEAVLPYVTINQATYLGLDYKIGSLDKGKQADITILNQEYDVIKTIVKGSNCYEK